MSDESKKVELRSDEVEDILGRVPGWMTRNGIVMLFLFVLVMLLGSWIIRIPDKKVAGIAVTSLQPPADLEARTDGKIEELYVEDNEVVDAGKVMAVIENPADYEDVLGLKEELKKLNLPSDKLPNLRLPVNGNADLGTVQSDYALFYKTYRDYREFLDLNYHQRKIELLREEYTQYLAYSGNLDTRAAILKEDYELAEKQYQRDSLLFRQGVVSESNYETSKAGMLTKRAGWQEILSYKAENEIKRAGIREQILEMELKEQEHATKLFTSLEEALNRLKAAIASYEKQYLIIAPISGQVTFNQFWSKNQNVRTGEKVMTIIPHDEGQLVGKISLPLRGAGEVQEGQQVNIRFDNFPYMEYGMVRGEVSNVSKVPQDNFYTVEVSLPMGLRTYYGLDIEFSQNMQGQAEILTDKDRLLQRIFNPLRSAISRQRQM